MSGVAAVMLMYMSEEEAFWVLVSLSQNPAFRMRECWLPRMPLLRLKFYQFVRLLKCVDDLLFIYFS